MADKSAALPERGSSVSYVALISTALFALLTALVVAQQTAVIDRDLILSLRASACPWLTTALLAVTFTSGRLAVPAVILFAFALYRRMGTRSATYYVSACITAQVLNAILKHVVDRARPHHVSPQLTAAGGLSYPSADVMLAVVIFGLGTYMLSSTIRARNIRKIAIGAAALFVVLAAIARVYLGAHWPTDVAGGALAGVACAAFWFGAFRRPPLIPSSVLPVPIPVSLVAQEL